MNPYVSPWLKNREYVSDRLKGLTPTGGHTYSKECRGADQALDRWLHHNEFDEGARLDRFVREIERETSLLRWAGKLVPFTEGTPIGAAPKRRRQRKPTPAQLRKLHNQRMQWKQEDLLKLRRKNDAEMALIIKGRL